MEYGYGGGTLDGATKRLHLQIEANLIHEYSKWSKYQSRSEEHSEKDKAFYAGLLEELLTNAEEVANEPEGKRQYHLRDHRMSVLASWNPTPSQ